MEDDLDQALTVSHIDEEEVSHVADLLGPADERYGIAFVPRPQVSAIDRPFPV